MLGSVMFGRGSTSRGGSGSFRFGRVGCGQAVGVRQGCSGFGELCCGGRGTVRFGRVRRGLTVTDRFGVLRCGNIRE